MITKKLVPVLGISAALLAACTDQVPEIPASELYTRAFVKEFGVVDGSQDWNNATRGSVNVNIDGTSAVQVTARIDGRYYLLANYADITGSRTLHFDMPRGVTDITVRANGESVRTRVGATVDFASSGRAFNPGTTATPFGDIVISAADPEDAWIIPWSDVKLFTNKMPEGGINIFNEDVDLDFVFRSVGDIIIYPVYWETQNINQLGIAYLDNDGEMQHIPLYSNYRSDTFDPVANILGLTYIEASYVQNCVINDIFTAAAAVAGDRIIYDGRTVDELDSSMASNDDFFALINNLTHEEYVQIIESATGDDVLSVLKFNNLSLFNNAKPVNQNRWDPTYAMLTYVKMNPVYDAGTGILGPGTGNAVGGPSGFNTTDNRAAVYSRGVKVSVPVGMRYGMYIKRADGEFFYSVREHNEDKAVQRDASGTALPGPVFTDEGARHAATWTDRKFGWRWLSFEDCKPEEDPANIDINDMVFLIANAVHDDTPVVEIEDPDDPIGEPIKWLIACEDLGALDDFDFNDVVFEVEHVAGETTAKITPLAAGGTFETYLMRGDERISGEWHALFGGAPSTQMINTTTISHTAEPFVITVPDDFTISSSVEGDYQKNMGDFHIEVTRADGVKTTITPPGPGEAPQMMLIFQAQGTPWRWPIERHHIKHAYPAFTDWMNAGSYEVVNGGKNWFDTPEHSHTVNR